MDLDYKIYLERAENEINLSEIIMELSLNKDIQIKSFSLKKIDTYFSSVISHAYYCIFYCAKAYLLTKGVKTEFPEEHKKTYEEFKKFVEEGTIDVELLKLYKKTLIKAETILGIFKIEKKKRTEFTYQKLVQANIEPARESIENARTFFKNIYSLCEK